MFKEEFDVCLKELLPELIQLRRYLHMNPELGYKEFNTTETIRKYLEKYGITAEYLDKEKKLGLQYLLDSGKPGETILLRGDMDALPIQEKTGCEFSSLVEGVSHACGHDLNTVFVTGCAVVLSRFKDQLKGKVKFIWQCAEETLQGALMAIDGGAFADCDPKYCFGFHGYSDNLAGKIGIRQGNCLGSSDNLHITVKGMGGHAASPHQTIDPVMITGHVLTALQSLVARYHRPWDPVVLTIGMIHGGTALNITPASVELTGTIRNFNEELRHQLPALIERTCRMTAQAFGGDCDVKIDMLCPAVVVTRECFEAADKALKDGVGEDHLVHVDYPCMGSEDFAFFLQEHQGMQIQVGTAFEDPNSLGAYHTSNITFSEDSIYWGVRAGVSLALGIC